MKSNLSFLIKSVVLVWAFVLIGAVSCSRQKSIAKDKVSESPAHDAPDQAEIDSIKASYNKGRK